MVPAPKKQLTPRLPGIITNSRGDILSLTTIIYHFLCVQYGPKDPKGIINKINKGISGIISSYGRPCPMPIMDIINSIKSSILHRAISLPPSPKRRSIRRRIRRKGITTIKTTPHRRKDTTHKNDAINLRQPPTSSFADLDIEEENMDINELFAINLERIDFETATTDSPENFISNLISIYH